jgi:hypothetical protein
VVKPWTLWTLRIVVTVEAVLVFDQAVFAGQFLAGDFGALGVHRTNADVLGTVAVLQLIAAVLLWRPGRGPAWPIAVAATLFALINLQIALGFARVIAVHVPLGVAITIGTIHLLASVWRRPRPAPTPSTVEEKVAVGSGERA